jgi:integrase
MASHHEQSNGKWKVRWVEGGRRGRSRSITVSSERAALRLKVEIEDALDRHGRYEPRRAGGATAIGVIAGDYIVDCMRRCAAGTVANYAKYLELFKAWVGPHTPADRLSFQLLSDYHLYMTDPANGRWQRGHVRKHNYVLKHFSVLEAMWEFGWRRQARGEYTGVPQPDSLDLRRGPSPHKLAPTWSDMDAVIGVSKGWLRDLYVVLRCTGLRVQQAMGLRWDDLHVDGRDGVLLHVRPELGKSAQEKRGRWVPLAPVLVDELAGWGRREGWVVECPRVYKDGRPHRVARPRDASAAWTRAEVDERVWQGHPHHAFRSGFISSLKRAGADTEAVEFLVGHSRGIREVYAAPDSLPLLEAVRRVPPIEVGTGLVQRARRFTVHGGGSP